MVGLWRIKNGRETEREKAALPPPVVAEAQAAPRRDRQLNLKVSEECKRVFREIAVVQGLSAAALFEDMVAERAELLARAGHLKL